MSFVYFHRVRPRPTINFGICIRIDQTDALFHNGILEARSIEALLDLGHLLQAGFLPTAFIVSQTCQASADGCTRIEDDLCHFRRHLVPQINALPQLLPVT